MKNVVYAFRMPRELFQAYDNAHADKKITPKIINSALTQAFYICLQECLLGITEKESYLKRRVEELTNNPVNKTNAVPININPIDKQILPPIQINQSTNDWMRYQGKEKDDSDVSK